MKVTYTIEAEEIAASIRAALDGQKLECLVRPDLMAEYLDMEGASFPVRLTNGQVFKITVTGGRKAKAGA